MEIGGPSAMVSYKVPRKVAKKREASSLLRSARVQPSSWTWTPPDRRTLLNPGVPRGKDEKRVMRFI